MQWPKLTVIRTKMIYEKNYAESSVYSYLFMINWYNVTIHTNFVLT